MADSWEDAGPPPPPPPRPPGFNFNPQASTFNFNPNAAQFSFVPGGPPPPPPPPHPTASAPHAAVAQPPPPPPPAVPAPQEYREAPSAAPVASTPAPAAPAPSCSDVDVEDEDEPSVSPTSAKPVEAPTESAAVAAVTSTLQDTALLDVDEVVPQVNEVEIMKAYDALMADDPREHLNLVFIGHVDAGKSTLAGQILFLTGGVDKRTIEKYEREAKEKNREGWYMAYIMDTNEEERTKGITVEVGRAHFETEKKRYTVLDAPGHKNYVPNMIQGACQADIAILVVSSRKGEFETGFDRGGQTREHAQLAKTLGVTRLIVVINKLDDPTVCLPEGKWDKKRFDEIVNGMTPFLKSCGYNVKKDVIFIPLAALYGWNVREPLSKDICDWVEGGTLFETLDNLPAVERDPLASFRMPIVDRWRDMGTIVMGKSEAGFLRVGDVLQLMPNKMKVKVEAIYRDEKEAPASKCGENLRLRITGAEETDISAGFVLSSIKNPVPIITQFEAQIMIIELLEHNPIFTVGYKSILHIHTAVEECEVTKLVAEIDPKTKEQKKSKYIKTGGVCICRIQVDKPICIEVFSELAALGRFTLRDEGRTIAIGKVTKMPKAH